MNRRVSTIALGTFRESIRSKVLYSLVFFAVIIVAVSALFGTVTIGDQVKVIKDFGLFAISIFSVAFVVVSGSSLLHKELSRKTIYNVLSKPVHRWEYLAGKFIGLFTTVLVMIALMGIGLSVFVMLAEGNFSFSLLRAYFHIALELFIVAASVIFFSSIVVTPMLIGLFSFGLFLAGRSLHFMLYFIEEGMVGGIGRGTLEVIYWILPQLNAIQINDAVVYGESIPFAQSVWALVYAVSYGVILVIIAQQIFKKREFN